MARASYSATPLLRSLVHRPQGVILVSTPVIYHKGTGLTDISGRMLRD